MTATGLEHDAKSSLRRTRQMLGNAIQHSEDLGQNLMFQTDELRKILGLHDLVREQTVRGRGNVRALLTRAFWDKYIYHAVFLFYVAVVVYIQSKRYGNLVYRVWDWICWILSFLLSRIPGFNLVCWNYSHKYDYSLSGSDVEGNATWDGLETLDLKNDL